VLASATALAQWSPPATMNLGLGTGQIGISPSVLAARPAAPLAAGGKPAARPQLELSPKMKAYCVKHPIDDACRRSIRVPTAKAAPPRAPDLVFKPSPTVSQKVERDVINDLAQRNRGQRWPQLEAGLRLSNVKGQFDALLRLYGGSPTNLGDVLGAYLVLAWESYAGGTAAPDEWAAVSRHWRRNVRRSALATRTDAQKQALAETLAWRAMLVGSATRGAQVQDVPQLVALREGVRVEVRQATGIDFAHQRLTARGFEPV